MRKIDRKLLGLGLLALIPACASSEYSKLGKGDPFGDPSKFESLASNAYQPEVPVAGTTPSGIIDGSMLVSPPTTDRAPASVGKEEDVSSPDVAYTTLIRGNERFVNGTMKGEHRDETRRRELASAQKPFAIVLSCSDSRVPPELIFDQGLGDLFTIRVAGNVLGSAQVASIEYAVEHLGAKLILVMGHESCGAVKASLEGTEGKSLASAGSPDLDWLVGSIRPNLRARGLASALPEDPKIRKPVMANIDAVTDNLVIRSPIIGGAVTKGNLKIVRGIYSLDTGRVDFWGLK